MSAGSRPAELYQLDESTCLALLGVQHVGRLIVPGDDPYVIPLNYTPDHDGVVIRTSRRPVIDAVIDRYAVFEVDMFDDRSKSGWSVVVRGVARDISDATELDPDVTSGAVPRSWAPGERSRVLRISVERVTGRLLRGEVSSAPHLEHGYL